MTSSPCIRGFDTLSLDDVPLVGGKTAAIGELHRALAPVGVRVPPGFALTAQAFRDTLQAAGTGPRLHALLDGLDKADTAALSQAGAKARALVMAAPMPAAVETALRAAWRAMVEREGAGLRVAVRSSATAEDLPHASFAGQHDSFLGIGDEAALLDAVRRCQASLFNDRAIAYRIDQGFDHFQVALSVAVMKMVRSDLAASGVAFTLDPESGHPDALVIDAAWGLGENIVQGTVDPDEYVIHKPTWRLGTRCVLSRRIGAKQMRLRMVTAADERQHATSAPPATARNTQATPDPRTDGHEAPRLVNEPVAEADRRRPCLDDAAVFAIAEAAQHIEDHHSRRAGRWCPMDIEWAQDGPGGPIFIVQARPETVASQRAAGTLSRFRLDAAVAARPALRVTGRAVGERIAAGPVRRLAGADDLAEFRPGEVLVAATTTPDWEPVMKTAAAIVTERGGRTCHAAIVARELGIPAVVGATGALSELDDGEVVTVSCAEGERGEVYAGRLAWTTEDIVLQDLPRPRTRVMVNLGNPALAWRTARLPCDGVGLARIEFIISDHVRAHPMALLQPERIADAEQRARVRALWEGRHADGGAFFVERLAEGVATIAAAFWPRPVIVRLSDFKSSEYAALAGGRDFEPPEANPMLGLRGAARYLHPSYAPAFALECQALARVRGPMGLDNVQVMVPFCRRLVEARAVLAAMAAHGLAREAPSQASRPGTPLRIVAMCEIPNNVILIDDFAALFDAFSIGSNDLTQLTLGVDRDSALVADAFDERDPGMLAMYRLAIAGAHRHGRPIGICGQAPSDHPDLARALVEMGIDSLSLSPDRLLQTLREVADFESAVAPAAEGTESTQAACAD
jgi:pyruvate,water dikinase